MTNALMSQVVSCAAPRVSMAGSFVGIAARFGVLGLALLLPFAASGEPIQLKLSFFASERAKPSVTESSRSSKPLTPKARD